jgi:hypothetical protein
MPEIKRGSFSLNLGVFSMQAEVSEEDRQCAWELYCEIVTRVAIFGKVTDPTAEDFSGEVMIESFESLHNFFRETRALMRRFPVGRLAADQNQHLGLLINDLIVHVLRPFLEQWQADYHHWWGLQTDPAVSPFIRQQEYPRSKELLADWTALRLLARDLSQLLVETYDLVGISNRFRILGADSVDG